MVDTSSKHTQDIADEISENLEKLVGSEPEPDVKVAPAKPAQTRMDSATIKFDNLKFGKNYDPTKNPNQNRPSCHRHEGRFLPAAAAFP